MFSVLLFVTITVGFMKIMSDEQARTNDNELSQGAYDSALAGVEDGKRVLAACAAGDATACAVIDSPTQKCTTVSDAGFASPESNGEVYLKTNLGTNGTDFEQAYTCVKIKRSTPDYKGSMLTDSSTIVPLRSAPGDTFDSIVISWFAPDPSNLAKPPLLDAIPTVFLPKFANWSSAAGQKPPMLRAQLMQVNASGFKPADFDASGGSNTVYLYPKLIGSTTSGFAVDGRRSGDLEPTPVKCNADFTTFGGYACQITLSLTDPVGGGPADRLAYLRLTSIYNATDFQVQLKKSSGEVVNFYDVQPSIDSTGRAADVFRRVDARVERADPNESLLYPRATVDITGNFCKAFVVTTSTADYNAGPCTP
jgi:hypothetical protein